MRREWDESFEDEPETSTGREGFFLLFAGGGMSASGASLVCFLMSRNIVANKGFNVVLLLAVLIGYVGVLAGAVSLAFAYSRGTRTFAFASMIANGLVLTLMQMLR
jgi:hypothetical protein